MYEMIRVRNRDYGEYEELLLRRDSLRKEAYQYQLEYTSVFGDLITEVFQEKIACIRTKKMITFCQAALNKGTTVDQQEMHARIESEMKAYNEQLQQMMVENAVARSRKRISKEEVAKIKQLYHKLVKVLHPDINPKTDEVPELKQLWQMVVVSYRCNSLKDLEDAEILVHRALESNHLEGMEIDIPDLAERIEAVREDIFTIKETDPYQYKYLLADDQAVREKKEFLQAELKEYQEYAKKLDAMLNGILTSGVSMIWRMN